MSFLIKNDELLEKYIKAWDKVSNSIKEGFDSESIYSEKYLKTKISFMKEKSTQLFMMIKYQKKVPIVNIVPIETIKKSSKKLYFCQNTKII